MNNLTPYLNDISTLLHSAGRPEVALLQRYEITPSEQKINFILSLIGKLIEQDRMLSARSGG